MLQSHLGLLVITLSSLKLHTENNACMLILLTGDVSFVTSVFKCLQIVCEIL